MPPDKKKIDSLMKDIKWLEENEFSDTIERFKPIPVTLPQSTRQASEDPLKKKFLLPPEKQAYFQLSHYFRLVMVSIDDPGTALEIWLRGILPKLLVRYAITLEEWERITNIGDSDEDIQAELLIDWQDFYKETVKTGKIDRKLLELIHEGRVRVQNKQDAE